MKKIKNIQFLFLVFVFTFIIPTLASAQPQTNNGNPVSQTDNGNPVSQTDNGGQSTNIKLVNPLGNNTTVKTLPDLVQQILRIVLTVGTPLVAIAIIFTGFQFVAAQGKPEALTNAKKSFLMVIIGAAILLGAYVIAEANVGTINAIRG